MAKPLPSSHLPWFCLTWRFPALGPLRAVVCRRAVPRATTSSVPFRSWPEARGASGRADAPRFSLDRCDLPR